MKIVHVAPFAPARCGLYETVRDLVVAEQGLGHEVVLVDAGVPGEGAHVGVVDARGDYEVTAEAAEAAAGADVLVTHTAPPAAVLRHAGDVPIVHVLHGRPRSSYLRELEDPRGAPAWRLLREWVRDPRYSFVTLWREHMAAWRCVVPPERLRYVPAPVDLDRLSPEGPRHTWSVPGDVNVLVGDVWRRDVDPFELLVDLTEALPMAPGARVHLYALPGGPLCPALAAIVGRLRELDVLGEVRGMSRDYDRVIRAADVVVTPQVIATRSVREALACGTPVIAARSGLSEGHYVPGDPLTLAAAINERDARGATPREWAQVRHDARQSAKELTDICAGRLRAVPA